MPSLFAQEKLYPYLQAVEPNSICINWISHLKNPTSEVQYGLAADALTLSAKGDKPIVPGSYNFHKVKLENLKPNTKYYYRVVSHDGGKESLSEVFSFKTLPMPGQMAMADGHLRFLVLGDNQLQGNDRYNRFVQAAHDVIMEKWGKAPGATPDDLVAMTVMVGDQVDLGMPQHYENVHFAKNRLLSSNLAIQTLVGNHETYGIPGLSLYHDLFEIDGFEYRGIKSGCEDFFARQAGNVLFIGLCSEKTADASDERQEQWLKQILAAAESDPTVDWIISLSHRPYQTEQYIGDIYHWLRQTAVPMMSKLDKYVLHIGAHHHNYARGQLKEAPAYHMISGGTSWDQYWGYGKEENYDDVQKTISQWCFQLIDIDLEKKSFSVESYSIGSVNEWLPNVKVDSFHRIKNQTRPDRPSITNTFDINFPVKLQDIVLKGSEYRSPSSEEYNSTQFQVSKFEDFSVVQYDNYRHFEDLFGMDDDGRKDHTKDLNKDVNIFEAALPAGSIQKGINYARVRYRDRNLNWSEWSEAVPFNVGDGGAEPQAELFLNGNSDLEASVIGVTYSGARIDNSPWIGLYAGSGSPSGTNPAKAWYWAAKDSSQKAEFQKEGAVTFRNLQVKDGSGSKPGVVSACPPGLYRVVLMHYKNSVSPYSVDAETPLFYIGPSPSLRLMTETTDGGYYRVGTELRIELKNAPKAKNDVLHVFRVGDSIHLADQAHNQPKQSFSVKDLHSDADALYCNIANLPEGYYYAAYYVENSQTIIGNVVSFQVGKKFGTIATDKSTYQLNEPIVVTWSNTPGITKDWIGIYRKDDDPNVNSSDESGYSYTYFDGVPYGTKTIGQNELPKVGGEYFAAIFTNDSYTEVTNRAHFTIQDSREVPSITPSATECTYGAPAFVAATASNGKPVTVKSKNSDVVAVDNDDASMLHVRGVGEADIRIAVEGDETYQPVVTTVVFRVTPAPLSVTAKDVTKVYDGKPYYENGGVLYDGFVNGEDESVVLGNVQFLGAAHGAINAGEYGLDLSGLQAFNYAITFRPGMLRITPAPIEGVTLPDITVAYDGMPHSLAVEGTLPQGTTAIYDNNGKVDPGVYTVTANIVGNSNYQPMTLTGTLTITGSKETDPNNGTAPTAVENPELIGCRPNPATDFLIISSSTPDLFTLYNMLGSVVRTFAVEAGETRIDLRGVRSGVYILRGSMGRSVRLIVRD